MKNVLYLLVVCLYFWSCTGNSEHAADNKQIKADTVTVMVKNNPIEYVSFLSLDNLMVAANLFHKNDSLPVVVMCHQARYNKFEYQETAARFNDLGYNCLAIDQRSGGTMGDRLNDTYERAKSQGLNTDFLDAEQDILAAVSFAYNRYKKPVILMGSSYSASLALKIAAQSDSVWAVIAFSPGEYFGERLSIRRSIKDLDKPVFITSSKAEVTDAGQLAAVLPDDKVSQYIPTSEGVHGSKALWGTYENNAEYWDALTKFLEKIKK